MRFVKLASIVCVMLILGMGSAWATPQPAAGKTSGVKKAGPSKVKKSQKTTTSKYRVRKGDNLYTIAHAHGMKLGELQRLNGLTGNRLKPGQTLLVRGGRKSGGGKTQSGRDLPLATPSHGQLAEASDTIAGVAGIEPIARSYLAIPYRWGAESRRSTDCSGFTQQVYREFDIDLPRTAREQYTVGAKIEKNQLQSGDLLFFRSRNKKYPTHVGIYIGDGKMIHASRSHRKVVITDANHAYFAKRYLGARRIAMFLPATGDLETLARTVSELDSHAELLNEAASGLATGTTREAVEVGSMSMDAAAVPHDGSSPVLQLPPGEEDEDVDDEMEPEAEPLPEPHTVLLEDPAAAAVATLGTTGPRQEQDALAGN